MSRCAPLRFVLAGAAPIFPNPGEALAPVEIINEINDRVNYAPVENICIFISPSRAAPSDSVPVVAPIRRRRNLIELLAGEVAHFHKPLAVSVD